MPLPDAVLANLSLSADLTMFLNEEIDTAAFANKTLGTRSSATQSHALSEGIQQLELSLRSEVVAKHEELLEQLSGCASFFFLIFTFLFSRSLFI